MRKLYILPVLFLLFFASCATDDEDPNSITPTEVHYSTDIKLIIDNNCLNCHTSPPINGASMPLISYENVREAVENRDLIGWVESGSMPPVGDVLSDTEVQAIKDWQSSGFQK